MRTIAEFVKEYKEETATPFEKLLMEEYAELKQTYNELKRQTRNFETTINKMVYQLTQNGEVQNNFTALDISELYFMNSAREPFPVLNTLIVEFKTRFDYMRKLLQTIDSVR